MGEVCKMLSKLGPMGLRTLRTVRDFTERDLAPDYSISDWLRDRRVDREAQRRIRTAATRGPFLEDLREEGEAVRGQHEIRHGMREGIGISAAYLLELPIVSAPVAPFDTDPLTVHDCRLCDDKLIEEPGEVRHLINDAALARHEEWLIARIAEEVRSGDELVARARDLLEGLILCDDASAQLSAMRGTEPPFRYAVRHLLALAARARSWTSGAFVASYRYPCSDESEATKSRFGGQRVFRCPDGERRMFSWHSKINVDKWRVHFLAVRPGEPVLIGYVGRHLDTVTG